MDHDSGLPDMLLPLTVLCERGGIIKVSCPKDFKVLVPPSSFDILYEQFSVRIDLLFIITILFGVVLCPYSLCAEFCQSDWYTNLILATWLCQPILF